jgi:hypothetical protein
MMASNPLGSLIRREPLDRPFVLFMVASVAVFALLGLNEVSNDEWGMVRTLGQYQAVLVAILVASTFAQEFERGTILWGLTQRVRRESWFIWRIAVPSLAVTAGSMGLGMVLVVVHKRMPSEWLGHLTAGELASLQWQTPVGAGLIALGMGALIGIVTRRVVPAVSIAGAGMVGLNVAADWARNNFITPGQDLVVASWTALGIQGLVTVALLALAALLLKRLDI